jgi:hypothetical protein
MGAGPHIESEEEGVDRPVVLITGIGIGIGIAALPPRRRSPAPATAPW